jgi:hypothetical protein
MKAFPKNGKISPGRKRDLKKENNDLNLPTLDNLINFR